MTSRDQRRLLTNIRTQSLEQPNGEGIDEEDALLTGPRVDRGHHPLASPHTATSLRKRWKEIAVFVWALVATAAVVIIAVIYQHNMSRATAGHGKGSHHDGKRNLIFMVSDGMGPSSLSLTRSFRQFTEQLPYDDTLVLDELLIGQSRTRSASSLVTDSAAGATAFACGHKSYNGAISVLPNFQPCPSVMEAAKRMGYTTGLVVTTRITDATPAVFASHVRRREMEDEIALQMVGENNPLGRVVDLMLGGGRCHFMPSSVGGCRDDAVNVIELAAKKELGWNYIGTREEFDNLGRSADIELPLMGLFADTDIPYEIDRAYENDKYPSLEEMTRTALKALDAASKDNEKGFFVMIEGSRIDHAGHGNDPVAQVHEVLAYEKAMAVVLEYINKDATVPTLMVSTSDHETGGLAVARQLHETYPEYVWYPGVLANASHSASHTAHQYHAHLVNPSDPNSQDDRAYLENLLAVSLGITDASKEEMDLLMDRDRLNVSAYHFADMVSRRAQIGFSTHGHSAADVNIYSSDAKAAADLAGHNENTDVGVFLRTYLGLENAVAEVSKDLQKQMKSANTEAWLGSIPAEDERLDANNHMESYHSGLRRRHCEACGL